jgi:hypothetical protein
MTPDGSKICRAAIHSTVLYTIPPHVIRTVWHDVNRLPLVYKRRGRSPGRGGTADSTRLHALHLHHDIGISPQSHLRDLGASLLSHLAL